MFAQWIGFFFMQFIVIGIGVAMFILWLEESGKRKHHEAVATKVLNELHGERLRREGLERAYTYEQHRREFFERYTYKLVGESNKEVTLRAINECDTRWYRGDTPDA